MGIHPEYLKKYGLRHPAHHPMRIAGKAIRERAERHFSGKLLEIGCGAKEKHWLIGDRVRLHIGLDHLQAPHGLSAADIIGTAYAIPCDDSAFDCVLSTSVLEHLEEPELALREALRALKPGGCAIYTVPLFWHLHEEPRDFFRYTPHGIRHIFKKTGWEILELAPLSGFWTTFGAELAYYLRDRGGLLRLAIPVLNLLSGWLERFMRRDEKFSWMYLVVARKPAA